MYKLTENALMDSFIKLIEKKPLDKIKLKEITDNCGLSRNTFYYHYSDVYDLAIAFLDLEKERAAKEYEEAGSWENMALVLGRRMKKNKSILYHIFLSSKNEIILNYLDEVSQSFVEKQVKKSAEGFELDEFTAKIIVVFYKNAILGLIREWLKNDMTDSSDKIVECLYEIFDGSIDDIVKKTINKVKK